eukprot:scaffold34231_cov76-Phaeocystis_antarctica.AAC.7
MARQETRRGRRPTHAPPYSRVWSGGDSTACRSADLAVSRAVAWRSRFRACRCATAGVSTGRRICSARQAGAPASAARLARSAAALRHKGRTPLAREWESAPRRTPSPWPPNVVGVVVEEGLDTVHRATVHLVPEELAGRTLERVAQRGGATWAPAAQADGSIVCLPVGEGGGGGCGAPLKCVELPRPDTLRLGEQAVAPPRPHVQLCCLPEDDHRLAGSCGAPIGVRCCGGLAAMDGAMVRCGVRVVIGSSRVPTLGDARVGVAKAGQAVGDLCRDRRREEEHHSGQEDVGTTCSSHDAACCRIGCSITKGTHDTRRTRHANPCTLWQP